MNPRTKIEQVVNKWLEDHGITKDASHEELIDRIVAAVAEREEEVYRPDESNPFASGD